MTTDPVSRPLYTIQEEIDFNDVRWSVSIGPAVKREMIRYFTPKIVEGVMKEQKADTGRSDSIPDMEPIDDLAWKMADAFIEAAIMHIEEELGYETIKGRPDNCLAYYAEVIINDVELQYFAHDTLMMTSVWLTRRDGRFVPDSDTIGTPMLLCGT